MATAKDTTNPHRGPFSPPPTARPLTCCSYQASDTRITPLGSVQTYNSGRGLRQKYLTEDAAWGGLTVEEVDFKAE
jgi:hypothetical protein